MTDQTTSASLFDMFETSTEAEASGIWVPIGPARFKIARMGGANSSFKKEAQKRLKPFQSAMDSLPEKAADELAINLFVDTVLLDWENVIGKDGVVITFSKEAAKALFKLLPNLFAALQAEATKLSNFNTANLEAAAGN